MATAWRESNKAKWLGMRPAHDGELVYAMGSKANGNAILYTVGAGKILLVFSWWVSIWTSAAGSGTLAVYDATPVDVYYFTRLAFGAAGTGNDAGNRYIPFEVPAGYTIRVTSSAAGFSTYAGFDGILIDA